MNTTFQVPLAGQWYRFLILLVLFSTFFIILPVSAEQDLRNSDFSAQTLSIEDGLSQSTVLAIEQDGQGYLWFGTEDGLNKYDGYQFQEYHSRKMDSATLSGNWIHDIHESADGTLWVATSGGLDRLIRATGTVAKLPVPLNMPEFEPWEVYEDRETRLWLTTKTAVFEINPQTGDARQLPLPVSDYRPIFRDAADQLWLGTWGNGLLRYSLTDESFEQIEVFAGSFIRLIHEAEDGKLWLGTENGLRIFDPATRRLAPLPETRHSAALARQHITALHRDRTQRYWIGTRNNGLYLLSADRQDSIHFDASALSSPQISSNTIWSIHEDPAGLLWIGTGTGGGLTLLSPRRFYNSRHDPLISGSLSHNVVWSILEDSQHGLWVGTTDGLNYAPAAATEFLHLDTDDESPVRLTDARVWALMEHPAGVLWGGTLSGGLHRIDTKTMSVQYLRATTNGAGLSSDRIRALLVDRQQNIWIGTDGGGITVYDPRADTFAQYRAGSGDSALSDDRVWALLQDTQGSIWVGTYTGGLNRLDPESGEVEYFVHDSSDPTSIGSDRAWALFEDSRQEIWIGTKDGGLNRYDPECSCFTVYTQSTSALPNNTVYGIQEDDKGTLWLSTNRGISNYDPGNDTFTNYAVGDGLPSNEFNFGAHHRGHDGRMYFGSIKGFSRFDPQKLKRSDFSPSVVVTGFFKGDQQILEDVPDETEIALDVTDKFISFSFAALDYRQSSANRYRFRLHGVDPGWRSTSSQDRRASYSFLPPGSYTFEVRGTNRDGVWSTNVSRIHLTVPQPFWKSWWFRGGLFFALIAGVGSVFYRRYRAQQRLRRLLAEGREQERSDLAHLIHEGPIQVVVGTRQQLELLEANDSRTRKLQQIDTQLEALIRSLRNVCWDLGKPRKLEEMGLATALSDHLQELEDLRQIPNVSLDLGDEEEDLSPAQLLTLYRVAQKAINNVVQHADARNMWIRLSQEQDTIIFEVQDDGKGFRVPTDWLAFGAEHFGILSAMDAIEAVNGHLEIQSSPGQGTLLRVQLHPRRQRWSWFGNG